MGRVIDVLSFDPVAGVYTKREAPDPTDASNFVFVRESPNLDLPKRWEVIFFSSSMTDECLIAACETREAAEQEAKEFTVVLQKIIDALRAP